MANLGELIVELSLDTDEFNRNLAAAKKGALDAVKQMESAFSSNLSIGVDDSELTNLNKHLDSKVKHLKKVNEFFKQNPVTVSVDDSLLTDLNELLHKTTKKHTIEIEYKYKSLSNENDIEDQVASAVERGFKAGMQRGIEQSGDLIEKIVEKSVSSGASKADVKTDSSASPGTGRSIEDLVKEVKDGFSGAADDSKAEVASKAIEVVLKPGQDLLTGFFEGFTNDFGKELSSGFRKSLGETMGLNMENMGQKMGNSFSKMMGVNVKPISKTKQDTPPTQNNKTCIPPCDTKTPQETFSTPGQAFQSIATGLAINTGLKMAGIVQSAMAKQKTKTSDNPAQPIPLDPLPQKPKKPKPQSETVPIEEIDRTAREELKKLSIFNEIPQKVKEAIESVIEVGQEIDSVLEEAIKTSKQSAQKIDQPQTESKSLEDIIAQSRKIKTAQSKYNKTIKNVIDSNASIGDYSTIPLVYQDFKKVSSDSRKAVEKLMAEAKSLNATPQQINEIAQAKSPISAGEKSVKQEVSKSYLKVKKEADLIAKANQEGIQTNSSAFKTLGEEEAKKYIVAFKKILGISSPSKVFISIGAAIAAGLAIGLVTNKINVKKAADEVISTVKDTTEQGAESLDSLIENAVDDKNKAYATKVKQVFKNSRKGSKGSNELSQDIGSFLIANSKILSTVLPALGRKPTSVEQNIPMSHLGKFYRGNTDVIKFNDKNSLSPIIDAVSVFLADKGKQQSGYGYLGAFDSESKFANSSKKLEFDLLLKDLRSLQLTLGGFGVVKTKTGINAVDVYDWAGAKSKQKRSFPEGVTIPLPASINSKLISLLDKFPAIAKSLNLQKDDLGGYTRHTNLGKTRKQIETEAIARKEVLLESDGRHVNVTKSNLSAMSDKEFKRRTSGLISINPSGGIKVSDSLHDIIGGQSYVQQRQVPLKKERELKRLYSKIYKQLEKENKPINEETVFTHPDFLNYMYGDKAKQKSKSRFRQKSRSKPLQDEERLNNGVEEQLDNDMFSMLKNFDLKGVGNVLLSMISNQFLAVLPTGFKNIFSKIGQVIPKGILSIMPQGIFSKLGGNLLKGISGIIPQGLPKTFLKIGFNLVEGFLNGFSNFGSKSKVISESFFSLVKSVKKVLRISSPSLIMKGVGLDFGKGFEDGATASLVYSFHRISQEYKKFVDKEMNNPALTKYSKGMLARSKKKIDADLKDFAKSYKQGNFGSEAEAMDYLRSKVMKPNKDTMHYLGFSKKQQNQIAKAAKSDFDVLMNYDKNAPELRYQNILPLIRNSSKKVSTLLLASHKISEEYKKRIDELMNTPGISQSQKSLYAAQKNLIDKKLQKFVADVSSGRMTDKEIQQSILNAYKFSRKKAQSVNVGFGTVSSIVKESGSAVATSKQSVFKQLFDSIVDGFSSTSGQGVGIFSLGGYLRKAVGKSLQNMIEKNFMDTGRMNALSSLGLFKMAPKLFEMVTGGSANLTNLLPLLAPLLPGLIGDKAGKIGQFASNLLKNNNIFQPGGLLPSVIKSVTGIDLGREDKMGDKGGQAFGISKLFRLFIGSENPFFKTLSSIPFLAQAGRKVAGFASSVYGDKLPALGENVPRENLTQTLQNQIKTNISSIGIEGTGAKDLARQVLRTLFDSFTIKNPGNSNLLRGILEKNSKIVNSIRDFLINKIVDSGMLSATNGLGGRAVRIANAYASGNVEGAVNMTARTAQQLFKTSGLQNVAATMGIKIDTAQVKMAITALLLGISAFHKAFTQEGLNIGKAIIKGFNEAVANWKNVGSDVKREVRKALGAENPKEIWDQIVTQWKRGIVVPKNVFKDFWNAIGAQFKRDKMKNFAPDEREDIQKNMLSFIVSAASVFAPITTFATTLLPLVTPLLPLFGAIGGAVFMVRNQIQSLVKAMLELEPLQRRLNFLGGSKEGGKAELNYAMNTAKALNVPAKAATQAYSQIAIAARGTKLEGEGARDLFEGISASLGALGISGQDAELVFMAYTQMLSKGKISMEELRQQLGERFPPAMGIFAKALDISIPQLIEMSSAGSLLAEEVLPKVAKQLKIDYSGAAKGAEGFSISLTRLQNIGMEMSIKLVNAFGGLFSFVVDIFSNIASAINAILDDIIKIFSSFVIGVTATLGVGLVFLLKMNPVKTFLMNISGLLTAGIAALMGALGPFFLGILADVLDDFLGAQKTLMQNMYEGVSNGILWFLSSLDSVKRKITGKGLFDTIVGKPSENPFKSFIDGIGNITKVIPSGVIELLALVLMFEQLITLTKHFGMPMFKGLLQGLNGIRVSLVGMKNEAISPKGIQSLFTNTFDLSAQVESKQRSPIGTRLQDEIAYAFYSAKTTIATQMKGLWASFTGFFKQLPATIGASAIFGGFIDGISATKAAFAGFMANITAGFKAGFWQGIGASFVGLFQLVGNGFKGLKAALNFAWTQGVVGGLNAIGASLTSLGKTITSVGIIKAFTLLFSSDGMLASSARAAWGQALSQMLAGLMKSLKSLAKIGIEAGIALAFMFLARSDFSNPMQKSISEMARSVNGALGSISNSLAKVDEASKVNQKSSKELAKGYKNVADSIPSKGLQLDIFYVFGMKEEGYTTDDFVKNVNKALRGEIDKNSLGLMEYNKYEEIVAQREGENRRRGLDKNINTGFGGEYATDKISPKQKAILKKYDIKGLVSDTDYDITLGVKQVIDNLDYFDSVLQSSKKEFGNLGLTKETQNKYKARVKDVADRLKQIDIEVLGLSVEKSKATQQNTPESKKRAADLSKQIVQRLALRKELAKDVEANANSANVLLEEAKKLEDAAKTVPAPVRGAYLQIAKEMKDFAQEAKQIIEKSVPVNPLEQVYKDTLSALNRFQAAYDRFSANIDRSTALREERIYSSGANPGDVDYATRRSGIISQEQRVSGLSRLFTMRKAALDLLSTIPDSNLNTEAKDKITELRKQTQDDATSLATARSSLAKSRYDLKESLRQQQKQVDDYVRSVTKEIDQGRLEIKKANQEIQNANFKTKINEALTGLGDTEFTRYIDGLVSIIEQLNQTALSQIDTERTSLDFKNRIKDSQIEARELIRTLPSGKDIIGVTEDIESDMKQAFTQSSKELEALINAVRASAAKVTQQTQQTVKESGEANKNTEKLNENMVKANESVSNMNVSLQQTVDLLERSAGIKIDPYSNATPAPSTPTNNSSTSSNSSNSNGVQGVFSSLFSFFGASQNPPSSVSSFVHPHPNRGRTVPGGHFGDPRPGRRHAGRDFAGQIGEPIVSSLPGIVKIAKTQGAYGKVIYIEHTTPDNKKLETRYAHLSEMLVRVGDVVQAGQQIGKLGNTGVGTGPHLHFEIRVNGRAIDPTPFITGQTPISAVVPSASARAGSASNTTSSNNESKYGHLAYNEAPLKELSPITTDGKIKLRQIAAEKFEYMARRAKEEGVVLVPISGFRSIQQQRQLFFGVAAQRNQTPEQRAKVSAPPGYSEHHTGYAVDIGDKAAPGTNLNSTFEKTKAFSWLQSNAARFGFELSFPQNNRQGIDYEPWHWRFVGDSDSMKTFQRARSYNPETANTGAANTGSTSPSAGVNTGAIADSQKQREEILKQQDEANKKRAEALRKQNEASVIRNLDNFFKNTKKTIRESRDSTNSLVRSFSDILNEYSPDKLPDPLTPESIKLTDTLNKLNDTRQDIQERLNSLRQSFVKGTDGKLTDTLALFNPLRKGLEQITDVKQREKYLDRLNKDEQRLASRFKVDIATLDTTLKSIDVQKKEIEERIKLTKAMSRLRREYENRSKIRDSDNVLRQAELDISQKGREIGEYSGGKIKFQEQVDPKFSIKRVGTIDFTTPEQQKGYLEEIFQKQKTEGQRLDKEVLRLQEIYPKAIQMTDSDIKQYNIDVDKLHSDIPKFNQSIKENAKLVDELKGLRLIEELKKPTANPNEPRFNNLTELMKPRSKFGFGGMDEYKLEGNTYFPVTQDSQIQNSFAEGLMPFNQMQLLNIRSVPELQFEERKLQIEDALLQYELNTKELVAKGLLTSADAEARIEKYREITRIKRIQNQSQLEIDKANETKTEVDRRFERRDLMNSVDYNFSKSEFASRRYEIEKATALREAQINASVLLNEEQRTDLVRKNQEMQTKLMTDLTKDIKQTVIAMKQETAQTRLNIYRDKGGNQFQINAEQRRMDEERLKKEKQDELDKAKKEKEGGDIDDKEYEERTKEIEEKYKAKLEESKNAAKDVVSTIRQMVRDSLINDLSAGLTDVIMGVQKLDDVLNNLAKNMLNGLINIAIKSLMQSLVGAGGILDSLFKSIGGIFGGNSGGEVPSANDGGEVSSQYKGGVIKNYAGGGIIQSLNEAIVREKAANGGITPVVAVLTPGERVLSVADNAKFQSMGLDKAIKNNNIESVMNYAMGGNVSNSELKVRNIMNFASGGVIPPSPGLGNINQPTTNTTVNVPITIESQDGDKSPSIDPNAMQSAIKTAVIVEIQRQQRQGGILKR
jgi:D-alanyl-D-alanine carboxypeptidase